MLLDKNTGEIQHKIFKDIIDYLEPGDCIVRNNTKVIPARLYGKKGNWSKCRICIIKKYTRVTYGKRWSDQEINCMQGQRLYLEMDY